MQELGRMIKKLCSKLFSRIVITGVLILIQAAWFWSLFTSLSSYALAEPADDSLEALSCARCLSGRIPPRRSSRSAGWFFS